MSKEEFKDAIVYEAITKEKKGISFVWLIPLLIAGVLTWIAYNAYMNKGTNIEVIFNSAEGLKIGTTPLEYKGLELGKVTDINIYDIDSVKINILVNSEATKYVAVEGSKFWIQKPTVSLTKISGLNTLISGYKIEFLPPHKTKEDYDKAREQLMFKGLDSKPQDLLSEKGYYINLLVGDEENVTVGMPIFYNKFQIGEIVSKSFKYDKTFVSAYIYDKYNYLVNQSSVFVMNEALKVDFGASGLSIKLDSLYSAIVGGITVVTPNKDAKKIARDEVGTLYDSKEDLREKEYFHIQLEKSDGIDVGSPIMYKGILIGKISSLKLEEDGVFTKAYLYKKYKYLLTNNSSFVIEKPEISMEKIANLQNIVKGNFLTLKYKKGDFNSIFRIYNSKKFDINKDDVVLSLYSNSLNSISEKSKVYYKNIKIGKVISYKLTEDYKKIKIDVAIDKKYKKLLNDHMLFYDMSSKLIELKNLDLNINYSGIEPLLNGGIGLVAEKRKSALKKRSFRLYNSYKSVENLKRLYNDGFVIDAYFTNDFNIKKSMSILYKNQEIGFIKSIKFGEKKSIAKLFIYKKYKKYISNKSRFFKKGVINFKASLAGVIFQMDNFSSLIEGSIHLQNDSQRVYNKYQIFSSEDTMNESSNSIKIEFDNVQGVVKEFSKLVYKGVEIGKVLDIKLKSNGKIELKVLIYENYGSIARVGTKFFLKKPIISLEEVKNLGSTLSAVNIGLIKSNSKKFSSNFKGYSEEIALNQSEFGEIFKVYDKTATNVNLNSPIYYKNVEIGKVTKIDLTKDASSVVLDCLIYNKYRYLIRKNSDFYDVSGLSMKLSLFSESQIKTNTFTSILKGGLVVVNPYKYERKARRGDSFVLKKEIIEGWQNISPKIIDK